MKQPTRHYIDFHIHSAYSDGTSVPEVLVKDCAMLGLNAIALTDHDTTIGYAEAKKEADRWGIELLTGVEISVSGYHILGINFDIKNKKLQDLLEYSRQHEDRIAGERVKLLQETGMPITFEKVKSYFPDSRLGKAHLLMAMMLDSNCREFISAYEPEGYEKIIKPIDPRQIFAIYFRRETGIAGKIGGGEPISAEDAIKAINDASGISIIAHPFKDVNKMSDLERLAKCGLKGVEIQLNQSPEKNQPFYDFAEEHGLIKSFGSDYHGARYRKRPLLGMDGNLVKKFWK